jgi:hypothetical protein
MIKRGMFSVALCWEAIVLFLICTADLLSTSVILTFGGSESNPVMNTTLELGGIPLLVLVKFSWLYLAIFLMESIRVGNISFRKKIVSPGSIKKYYRACIIVYVFLYGVWFAVVNL